MLIQIFESLLYKNMIWLFFEIFGCMLEYKNIFYFIFFSKKFSMFWRKLGILIPDLYIYGIKIQTNTKQNSVGKSQIFLK